MNAIISFADFIIQAAAAGKQVAVVDGQGIIVDADVMADNPAYQSLRVQLTGDVLGGGQCMEGELAGYQLVAHHGYMEDLAKQGRNYNAYRKALDDNFHLLDL